MIITKVINNNIVCTRNEQGSELIMTGCGLGFRQKAGDTVPEDKIEKIYRLESRQASNKLLELLSDIPLEHMNTCNRIIDYAKSVLSKKLNENIYITLTDHISFAIQRLKENLEYKNALLWEIKKFYPKEFEIGTKALEMIREDLGVQLSEHEAGFIALHIVNAQLGTSMENAMNITTLIHDILTIVKDYYQIRFDEDSLYYGRFITHLKFFGQRVFQKKNYPEDDFQFQDMVRQRYQHDYECAERIRDYTMEKYKHRITGEEMMYLTVHLKRVTMTAEEQAE